MTLLIVAALLLGAAYAVQVVSEGRHVKKPRRRKPPPRWPRW